MLKVPFTALALLSVLYLGLCSLLYFRQRAMIYYPTPPVDSKEADAVWLSHQGQRLKIWHVPHEGEKAILYFGGNAEEVSLNLPRFRRLFPDHALYLANYRGYGGSTGSPSEEALTADASLLYDFAARQHSEITVIGRSLGTGIAVVLATERPVSRLVLITPYDSMVNLAAELYPIFPVRLLMQDSYDSLARAPGLAMDILLLIAERDEVIPRPRSEALAEVLPPEKTRVRVIPAAGHNTIDEIPLYDRILSAFINGTGEELNE